MANHGNENDRFWSAVLYALGEGSADERSLFEDQLSRDESLCDLLVQAVHLMETTRLSQRQSLLGTVPLTNTGTRTAGRIGTVTAIASLAGLFLLACASGNSVDTLQDAEVVSSMLSSVRIDDADDIDAELGEWTSDLNAPNWLLTAVEIDDKFSADSEDPDVVSPEDDSSI